jgi:hypothetical protein
MLMWLAFHGLLRPGEALSLVTADVVFTAEVDLPGLLPSGAVVTIARAKTRKRGASRQHVLLTDPHLVAFMRALLRGQSREAPLCPYTEYQLRKGFEQLLQALGVSRVFLYTLGSLRAGSASFEYLSGRPVSAIKFRGRWSAEKTLEHYLQASLTYLDLAGMPPVVYARTRLLATLAPQVIQAFLLHPERLGASANH